MKYFWIIILLIIVFFGWKIMSMEKENNINYVVILVPGLNDSGESKLIKNIWKKDGIDIIFFESKWKSDENYQIKLERLLKLIDEKSENNKVSLIGMSAGGSLVINAFNERKNEINKVIAICSRLKKGKESGFRGFVKRTKKSLSFKESILNSEKDINDFSLEERQRIMTIHALFGDELVPGDTSTIDGANNVIIPTTEHVFSIVSSLTWYSKLLVEFVIN